MDIWFYFDTTHALHAFCNPMSEARAAELGRVMRLRRPMRVLDLACGHGEFLVRWAKRHGIGGVGVDISEYAIERAETRGAARIPDAEVRFVNQAAQDFTAHEQFDVAMCIGASWVWHGFAGTLKALRGFAKPGGLIVSGEPYWIADPPDEYLSADGLQREQFHTLAGCRAIALEQGLELVWMAGSTLEDWDRYEMLQTLSVDRFARDNPEHPDLDEIRRRRAAADATYFRWGRKYCGFATWVFRAPSA